MFYSKVILFCNQRQTNCKETTHSSLGCEEDIISREDEDLAFEYNPHRWRPHIRLHVATLHPHKIGKVSTQDNLLGTGLAAAAALDDDS